MKNQYIGDVGDYGKYGLLRFLQSSGISIGVNWYLTPNDGGTAGKHKEYLEDKDERMRGYDPELYDAMRRIAFWEDKTIGLVERDGILGSAHFYHAIMDFSSLPWQEREVARTAWHQGALQALQGVDLVFADPDNSLSMTQTPAKQGTEKYILPNEIMDYFNRGQQVMYYHHRSRAKEDGWLAEKRQILKCLPDAKLLAMSFRRWSMRTYIFVVHEDQYALYAALAEKFLDSPWGTSLVDGKVAFTSEPI